MLVLQQLGVVVGIAVLAADTVVSFVAEAVGTGGSTSVFVVSAADTVAVLAAEIAAGEFAELAVLAVGTAVDVQFGVVVFVVETVACSVEAVEPGGSSLGVVDFVAEIVVDVQLEVVVFVVEPVADEFAELAVFEIEPDFAS